MPCQRGTFFLFFFTHFSGGNRASPPYIEPEDLVEDLLSDLGEKHHHLRFPCSSSDVIMHQLPPQTIGDKGAQGGKCKQKDSAWRSLAEPFEQGRKIIIHLSVHRKVEMRERACLRKEKLLEQRIQKNKHQPAAIQQARSANNLPLAKMLSS